MSLSFHPLKIHSIRKETKDSVHISFDVPLLQKRRFSYLPGQYLTLKVFVNGKEYRRSYSLCSDPFSDKYLSVAVKQIESGIVSTYLNNEVKAGDVISVIPPMGHFNPEINKKHKKQYLLVAAGSGITPILGITKALLKKEKDSSIVLVYGNRTEDNRMFHNDLEELQNQYSSRFQLIETLSQAGSNWEGKRGRISTDLLEEVYSNLDKKNDLEIFICGPVEMMQMSEEYFLMKGIDNKHLHLEYFINAKGISVEDTSTEEHTVEILLNGEEHNLKITSGQKILDVAIEANIDPPYSCQSGICTTCMARLLKGKVRMDEDLGLSDEDKAEGYILTCQSHVVEGPVKVEYE